MPREIEWPRRLSDQIVQVIWNTRCHDLYTRHVLWRAYTVVRWLEWLAYDAYMRCPRCGFYMRQEIERYAWNCQLCRYYVSERWAMKWEMKPPRSSN